MSDKNKKLDGISHGKAVRRTTPLIASQPSNNTNVYKDIETTKLKLRNLAERWIGVNKIKGFLTELWETLGINKVDNKQQKGGNPSRYAAFILQDGTILTITIRASAHNARAKNYLKKGNVNGDINLSIVLQKRSKKNRFEPNENVRLIEYVYLEDRISDIENPLSQIAMSLVGYLTNGQYIDTTGVAITPSKTEQIKEYKTNINMSKNKIRITENELKQIVAESVKKILSEARKPSDKTVDINEAISTDYSNALKQLLAKSFSTLNDNEKIFLSDLLNNEPWETIYTALNILGQNRVNEGKTVNNKPMFYIPFEGHAKPGQEAVSGNGVDFFRLKGYKNYRDAKEAVERGELSKEVFDGWINDIKTGLELHNMRTDKYDKIGDISWSTIDSYGDITALPSWGRASDERRCNDRMKNLRHKNMN